MSILTTRPGAGKSTLLLQLSESYAKSGFNVLYISGEESESQIKSRADRIMDQVPENMDTFYQFYGCSCKRSKGPRYEDLFGFYSNFFSLSEFDNKQGSPTQTIECANKCVELAKDGEKERAFIMVGRMTKTGENGKDLRTLEHLVDTVWSWMDRVKKILGF